MIFYENPTKSRENAEKRREILTKSRESPAKRRGNPGEAGKTREKAGFSDIFCKFLPGKVKFAQVIFMVISRPSV